MKTLKKVSQKYSDGKESGNSKDVVKSKPFSDSVADLKLDEADVIKKEAKDSKKDVTVEYYEEVKSTKKDTAKKGDAKKDTATKTGDSKK